MSAVCREACPDCGAPGELLYRREPTDPTSELACANCVRQLARQVNRYTPCDNDPAHGGAWRNPFTRRNEYLCGNCHVASGDGVVQNRWAGSADWSRESRPLGVRTRDECEARNVPGTRDCHGEVKPRGKLASLLCNRHAGKTSAAEAWGR